MPIRDYWRGLGGGDTSRRSRDDRELSHGAGHEDRSFERDPSFQAEDARLNAALHRQERERGLGRPLDYGHDGTFRPGYHEGGSRFGFFPLSQTYGVEAEPNRAHPGGATQGRAAWRPGGGAPYGELRMEGRNRGIEQYGPPADYAFHPDIDQDFDPDYLHWRSQQLQRHDRDYADWRQHQCEQYDDEYRRFRAERRDDFHQRFQDWRAQRETETKAVAAPAAPPPDDKI